MASDRNEEGGQPPTASSHDTADWFEQRRFQLRFGWGPNGLRRLAPAASAVVIVDVLSFSTAVDVALGRGVTVLPYRWHDGSDQAYAEANDAVVAANPPQPGRPSLRPSSLIEAEPGLRLVLPSPNGSALAFGAAEAGASSVLVGSFRNATAVGKAAAAVCGTADDNVAVIAAGERWRGTTGPLRPAIEDLLGAGAILAAARAHLNTADTPVAVSPEAHVAIAAFDEAKPVLAERIAESGSGRELSGKARGADIDLAVDLDVSSIVPTLVGSELVPGRT